MLATKFVVLFQPDGRVTLYTFLVLLIIEDVGKVVGIDKNVIEVRGVHNWNALLPMLVTELGILIEAREEQL